jgi:cytochrome c oxidase cbb3-type subunit I/II
MVRPIRSETERYGEYSKPGEFVYDRPFQWGSRRIGPDLHRVGGKYPHLWHLRHMQDPQSTTPQSIMPKYPWLVADDLDFSTIQPRVDAMAMLGVPYGKAIQRAEPMAREQAAEIALELARQGGQAGLEGKKIIAMIAYLQRLGTDIKKTPGAPTPAPKAPVAGEPRDPEHAAFEGRGRTSGGS